MASTGVKVAEKAKVGILRKIGNHIKLVIDDYKLVGRETRKDMSESPVKASVYAIALSAVAILGKANPSERDLEDTLINNAQDISLVGAPIRNRNSDKFIDGLRSAQRDGRLHHTSFGLFSCVWISEYRHELDLYEAQCKYTKIPWYQWHRQIVDVGILGKFIKMSRAMEDYDVNEEEWGEKTSS